MHQYPADSSPSLAKDALLGHAARIAQLSLPARPRLPSWISLYELGDDRLQLASPSLSYTLTHPLFVDSFRAVLPLLNGTVATEELVQAAASVAEPSTTLFLLKVLFAHGILYEGEVSGYPATEPTPDERARADFFASFTPEPATAQAHLAASKIFLALPGHLAPLMQADLEAFGFAPALLIDTSAPGFLTELQVQLSRCEPGTKPLLVAALNAPARSLFTQINRLCLSHTTRWLHIEVAGPRVILGPCVVPFQSACYTCYLYRSASHLPYRINPECETEFVRPGAGQRESFAPLWRMAFAQAAMECARLLTGFASPTTIGRCHEIEASQVSARAFDVLKLPRCPSCGKPYPFLLSAHHVA